MRHEVRFFSAVGGGPTERLARALNDRGRFTARTASLVSTVSWRRWRGGSRVGSLAVRGAVFFLYPFLAAWRSRKADVAVVTTNPFWLPNLLLLLRPWHRATVITLAYDIYPDSLAPRPVPALLSALMHGLNRHWMRASDAVVFIAASMRAEMLNRCPAGVPRHEIIETGTQVNEFDDPAPQPDLEDWIDDRVLVSYVGNAGNVHDVRTFIAVVRHLSQRRPDDVAVFISTSGSRSGAILAATAHLSNVRCEPALSDQRWRWVLARTDVAVVTLSSDTPTASMPSKFYSALGARCAVLVVAPRSSDLYRITEAQRLGVAVEPGHDAEAIRRLEACIADTDALMLTRERAGNLARGAYDVDVLAERWEGLFELVTQHRGRPADAA